LRARDLRDLDDEGLEEKLAEARAGGIESAEGEPTGAAMPVEPTGSEPPAQPTAAGSGGAAD